MKPTKRFASLAAVTLLASMSVPALAADAPEKAAVCTACHGPGGGKPIAPEYPVLAGQHANYLAKAMHEYKSGARTNAVMAPQAATLSEHDIEELARYFSMQSSPLYTPSVHSAGK